MKNIIDYIKESKDQIQGLKGYTIDEVTELIEDYVDMILSDIDCDIDIEEIWMHGSRMRGTAKNNSDLDVVVFYDGSTREDDLFNSFHDDDTEPMYIDDVLLDFNFVKVKSEDEINDYKKKSNEYDKEILKGK